MIDTRFPAVRGVLAFLVSLCSVALVPADAVAVKRLALDGGVHRAGFRQDVSLTAVTGVPRQPCRGTLRLGDETERLPRKRSGRHSGVRWTWQMDGDASAGRLVATVRCKVNGSWVRRAKGFSIKAASPNAGTSGRIVAPRTMRAETFKPKVGGGVGGGGFGGYPADQCTAWVMSLRRDLVVFPGDEGDAMNWAAAARARGWEVTLEPHVGDVAVFGPYQQGAGPFGHVAVVTAVNGPEITVSEANWHARPPGEPRSTRWEGLQFIGKRISAGRPPEPANPTAQPTDPKPPPSGGGTTIDNSTTNNQTCTTNNNTEVNNNNNQNGSDNNYSSNTNVEHGGCQMGGGGGTAPAPQPIHKTNPCSPSATTTGIRPASSTFTAWMDPGQFPTPSAADQSVHLTRGQVLDFGFNVRFNQAFRADAFVLRPRTTQTIDRLVEPQPTPNNDLYGFVAPNDNAVGYYRARFKVRDCVEDGNYFVQWDVINNFNDEYANLQPSFRVVIE